MRFFGLLIAVGLAAALPDMFQSQKPKKSDLIIEMLQLIGNQTLILNATLTKWDGTILDAQKIQTQNNVLLKTLRQAEARIAGESPKIGVRAAIRVGRVSKRTEAATNETAETMIQLYRRFKGIALVPNVRKNLYATQNASATLNRAVERKMPKVARPYCRKAGRRVDRIFQRALKFFDPKEKGPKQPKNPDKGKPGKDRPGRDRPGKEKPGRGVEAHEIEDSLSPR